MNHATWERPDLAARYGKRDGLFPAEQVIVDLVLSRQADVVDIGIGGGRTTRNLVGRCRSYVGIDYSAAMVAEARRTCPRGTNIVHANATDLALIADASADFVLFSFNGIDYVAIGDRLKILCECRRICRVGGYFAFSSHNLAAAPMEFLRKPGIKGFVRWALKQALNFPLGAKLRSEYTILNDGEHRFGLRHFYIKPRLMLKQLADAGFSSIEMFDFHTGSVIDVANEQCPFPYYLAIAG